MKTITRSVLLIAALALAGITAGSASASDMVDAPIVKLRALDKVTARTVTFEARVGSTIKFGGLYIKVQSCRKAPPIEQPEAASFLQIWEITHDNKAEWAFSGWMFASSPALSHMDHPIYDVWVLDCLRDKGEEPAAPSEDAIEGEGEIAEEDISVRPDTPAP